MPRANPTSSNVSVQPRASIAFPLGAGRLLNNGGKRPSGDESDAEDNDRGKRPRDSEQAPKPRWRCPFKHHDPENPNYEKCGTFPNWARLREHLLIRTHKPRDRCPTCGEIFSDDVGFRQHTNAKKCERSPKALEKPYWVGRHQAASIKKLSTQGRKNVKSTEELYREVCEILFGRDSAPHQAVRAQPARIPQFQRTANVGVDHGLRDRWETFKRTIGDQLGMQNVPGDDSAQQVIESVLSWLGTSREQIRVVQSQAHELGEAAMGEQLGINETTTEDWMPYAPPAEKQVTQVPEPHRYPTQGLGGQSIHSFSDISTYLWEEAGMSPPVTLDSARAFSVGHQIDKLNHVSEYVDPAQLHRMDAHHIRSPVLNDSSLAVPPYPPGSAGSQASDATVLGSSSGQIRKDADCMNAGEMPDNLEYFDFTVQGYNHGVGSM
ncbi:hypothetical protein Daus18300_005768 [Diaporthe australafricana]|uniref:C2H2-type domain-containing protein n=1 Tax=Diaporthe australafricana TaxID=127596 RepID=A0ABR3WZP0_9PEZI